MRKMNTKLIKKIAEDISLDIRNMMTRNGKYYDFAISVISSGIRRKIFYIRDHTKNAWLFLIGNEPEYEITDDAVSFELFLYKDKLSNASNKSELRVVDHEERKYKEKYSVFIKEVYFGTKDTHFTIFHNDIEVPNNEFFKGVKPSKIELIKMMFTQDFARFSRSRR